MVDLEKMDPGSCPVVSQSSVGEVEGLVAGAVVPDLSMACGSSGLYSINFAEDKSDNEHGVYVGTQARGGGGGVDKQKAPPRSTQ